MKTTDAFKTTIQSYLEDRAKIDQLFAVSFAKDGKNIDDCCTYILNTVKASGCSGFVDVEVFSMAVHYYDEDDIKIGSPIKGKVVVNHSIPKIDNETEDKKPIKRATEPKIEKKLQVTQFSLFD